MSTACDRCADAREIAELRAALLDARDCRTCRNFTTRSGGCVSVLRCVDGSGYKRQGRFQYWEAAPVEPAKTERFHLGAVLQAMAITETAYAEAQMEIERLRTALENMRRECDRAWKEVDVIARERNDHA